ncbi:glycosyltransferase [Thiotrichales bacterium 19X7-9]|nr:glycosyltransferase [Thiotrichales bacterium 19X7-9]
MISIIIPTFNEIEHGYLEDILSKYQLIADIEIICVDSNSDDGTKALIQQSDAYLISTEKYNRAARINEGILQARGDLILLHHPRSILPIEAIDSLQQYKQTKYFWGGFKHQFDLKHPFLSFISWYSNQVRFIKKNIVYLDHCIFLTKDLASLHFPIKELDIFEDTLISELLSQSNQPQMLNYPVMTSSIRFQQNGIYKQWLSNQLLKFCYKIGISDHKMNRFYEKNCPLNVKKSTYKK